MKRNEHPPQRSVTLPPLNLTRMESRAEVEKHTDSESTVYLQRNQSKAMQPIMEASHTVLFTASSLHRTLSRCLGCTGNESLQAAFSGTLHKTRTSTEKLGFVLDLAERKRSTETICQDLLQATSACIHVLKEVCATLRTRLSILVQGLDTKYSRTLLMHLYSATIDMKDAWQVIQPYLTTQETFTKSSFRDSPSANSPIMSPLASPGGPIGSGGSHGDNTQLYNHLRNAVTGSLHVLNTLCQTITETKTQAQISVSLEKKLNELARQAQLATDLCHRLDKNVESNMGKNKEDLLLLPTRTESSRRIWEDTSIYLKTIVGIMTFIRSISKEEDFAWPKSVKQGCLYVTRMTAEVAKLWNQGSTFAQDGFYLGRPERSASVSDQPHPLILSHTTHSPAADIPMQRRNTQQ